MSIRSTTNYGGNQLPSSVWTKMDYLERETKGRPKKDEPSPVSKPEGTNLGKPSNPRKDKKLQDARLKDLKQRNLDR